MLKGTTIKRRAIRRFTDEEMPLEILKEFLMYASMAPSNTNTCPVEFIVVSEKEDVDCLAAMDHSSTKYLTDASLAVSIVANKDICKYWVQGAAMTTAYLDLLVQEEDYQSGYLPFHDNTTDKNADARAYVRNYFNIPDNYGVLGILTIGKKDERARTWREFPIDEKIHENHS